MRHWQAAVLIWISFVSITAPIAYTVKGESAMVLLGPFIFGLPWSILLIPFVDQLFSLHMFVGLDQRGLESLGIMIPLYLNLAIILAILCRLLAKVDRPSDLGSLVENSTGPLVKKSDLILKRAGAEIIDFILVSIVSGFLISSILGQVARPTFLGFSLVHALVLFVYAGYFNSNRRATIGKRMFSLRVVSSSGGKLSFLQAGLRDGIGKQLSRYWLGIGYFLVFFLPDQKAFHDFLFKTRVVEDIG